jgi:hypothetical protein
MLFWNVGFKHIVIGFLVFQVYVVEVTLIESIGMNILSVISILFDDEVYQVCMD